MAYIKKNKIFSLVNLHRQLVITWWWFILDKYFSAFLNRILILIITKLIFNKRKYSVHWPSVLNAYLYGSIKHIPLYIKVTERRTYCAILLNMIIVRSGLWQYFFAYLKVLHVSKNDSKVSMNSHIKKVNSWYESLIILFQPRFPFVAFNYYELYLWIKSLPKLKNANTQLLIVSHVSNINCRTGKPTVFSY